MQKNGRRPGHHPGKAAAQENRRKQLFSPAPRLNQHPFHAHLNDEVAAYRFGLGLDTPPPHVRPELWRRLRFWHTRGHLLPGGIFVIPGGRS